MKDILNRIVGWNPDFMGIVASMTCAVHCLAVPLIASMGMMNTGHHNHVFDFVFLSFGLVFAGFSLFRDVKVHRNFVPILLGLVGFTMLIIGILNHISLLSFFGGSAIAIAHIINFRFKSTHCTIKHSA